MSENEFGPCPACGKPANKSEKTGRVTCDDLTCIMGQNWWEPEFWKPSLVEEYLREQIKARDMVIEELRAQNRMLLLASPDTLWELKY